MVFSFPPRSNKIISCLLCKSRNAEEVDDVQDAIARGMDAAQAAQFPPKASNLKQQAPEPPRPSRREKSQRGVPHTVVVARKHGAPLRDLREYTLELAEPVLDKPETEQKHQEHQRSNNKLEEKMIRSDAAPWNGLVLGDTDEQSAPPFYRDINTSRTSISSTCTTMSTSTARRRSKRFHNVHPAQAKIRAKLDIFEGRTSMDHRAADDLTESETMDSDDPPVPPPPHYRRRGSSFVPVGHVLAEKDCENDPYAEAYKVWYKKGLLYFRPKGLPERDIRNTK